jgi:adenylate kinase family enzyme
MRLIVVGCSGSGKTTMGRRLAEALGVPHTELDALNWDPGWRDLSKADPGEFRRRIAEVAAGDAWVMDGNYTKARDVHWARATAFVWMDPPLHVVMRQVTWRSFSRAATKRELWPGTGNKELFRRWLGKDHPIRWAWDNRPMIRRRYEEWFAGGVYEGRPVWRVTNAREARRLVADLAAKAG